MNSERADARMGIDHEDEIVLRSKELLMELAAFSASVEKRNPTTRKANAMTNNEMRIAVAESVGWKLVSTGPLCSPWVNPKTKEQHQLPPNYPEDLNEMARPRKDSTWSIAVTGRMSWGCLKPWCALSKCIRPAPS